MDQKETYLGLIAHYRDLMGYTNWCFRVHFTDEDPPERIRLDNELAAIIVDSLQQEADLCFDIDRIQADDDPERVVRHKFAHIPHHPLQAYPEELAGDNPEVLAKIAELVETCAVTIERMPVWNLVRQTTREDNRVLLPDSDKSAEKT